MFSRLKVAVAILMLSVLPLTGCGQKNSSGGSIPHPVRAKMVIIHIRNNAFSPKMVTVHKGTKVEWINNDVHYHTVTSDTGKWDSGSIEEHGGKFTRTFSTQGSYMYHCKIHKFMAHGRVVVVK